MSRARNGKYDSIKKILRSQVFQNSYRIYQKESDDTGVEQLKESTLSVLSEDGGISPETQ
jgi:hypothetical protein